MTKRNMSSVLSLVQVKKLQLHIDDLMDDIGRAHFVVRSQIDYLTKNDAGFNRKHWESYLV